MKVEEKLAIIQSKINSACEKVNRDPSEVNIIAVTKYVSNDRALEAIETGITHLGENRDDLLNDKWEAIGTSATWHFIGTLQSRKVKNILDKVSFIHSLDRLSLAKEINKRASGVTKCFVQVNVSGEKSKHGLEPEKAIEFIQELEKYPKISVVGLMTMAPNTDDKTILRACFKKLKQLQEEISKLRLDHAPCKELSMGMSNDYEIAVEEGATFVRIGTALVGE